MSPPAAGWVEAGVGRVHLNAPESRNALSFAMSEAIADAVDSVVASGAGAIVVTAAPPTFCAGGALGDLLQPKVDLAEVYRGVRALAAAPIPTIAAVGGAAIGAGVTVPLACDVVLASPDARFDPRFLDVAIHPGGGHLWRLARRAGRQAAVAMVLLGEVVDGTEAAALGLAWRCVPADRLESEAQRLAARAAGRDGALMRRTKASLDASLRAADVEHAAAIELEAQRWSVRQPAHAEAVRRIAARVGSGVVATRSAEAPPQGELHHLPARGER